MQALDVFPCDKNYPTSLGKVKILAGVRSGDVVECHIDFNRDYYTEEDIMNEKSKDKKKLTMKELEEKQEKVNALRNNLNPQEFYTVEFHTLLSSHSSL